ALDLVHEATVEEEVERAVHGRGRDLFALSSRQLFEDRIGPERRGAVAENAEHPPAKRRQMEALAQAVEFDPRRPGRRIMGAVTSVRHPHLDKPSSSISKFESDHAAWSSL